MLELATLEKEQDFTSCSEASFVLYSGTVTIDSSSWKGNSHEPTLTCTHPLPPNNAQVAKKAKLTKLVFNPKHPIILVGDDKGVVTSLKLSPNLRKCSKPERPGQKAEEMEVAKLDQVIEVARKSEVDVEAGAAAGENGAHH